MSTSVAKIYVDMDGVLSDFNKKYMSLFGVPASDRTNFEENFRELINGEHFASLPKMSGFLTLVAFLDSLDIPKTILSSTGRKESHAKVSIQKMIWLMGNNIQWPKIFVPGKHLKKQYATSNSILIDDTPSVIDDWNEAGGIGILHTSAKNTIAEIKKYI